MVLKCVSGLAPQHMPNMFNFAAIRENLRQCNNSKVLTVPPGQHKVVFEQSYRYSSVELWKKIKPEI